MGFPEKVKDVKEVYLKYCCSQGVTREEAEKDLQVLENYIRERRVTYIQMTERQRREACERVYHSGGRLGNGDPECNVQ